MKRRSALIRWLLAILMMALCSVGSAARRIEWLPLDVTLPTYNETFPPGPNSDIASTNCLICHSADQVMQQPPQLSQHEWEAVIHKMKQSYGAPIPDDRIAPLAAYLTGTFSGRHSYGTAPPAK